MERKRTTFFILIAVLIGVVIGIFAWRILAPKLGVGIFYYRIDKDKVNMYLLNGQGEGEKVISIDGEEVELGKYKAPRHSFVSSDNRQLIYFKKTREEVIQSFDDNMVASRIFYEPILINLKTGTEKKINQSIDSMSLLFSPDNNSIAWIKEVQGSTYEEIEKSNQKRELWISRVDGESPQLLISFDENVILLKRWHDNYIYFQGIFDVNTKSLGRVNIETKQIEYVTPQGCDENLISCQNFSFSLSGNLYLYEIYTKKNDKEITELYLGSFDTKEYKPILTTDRISDKIWSNNEKEFFYTEQEIIDNQNVKETIHLIDLYEETDKKLYSGSYISQLGHEDSSNYLYFLEKADSDVINTFKIVRLNIKSQKAETVLTDNYNNILIIQ